ncbi:MAG TPA: RsmD family RNA methyltransferase [Candidatus Krumholzibacteria bacterium]|nr:RsmD family RNA methyltransferase [Candidatus Krumholzibacteria bacterium]
MIKVCAGRFGGRGLHLAPEVGTRPSSAKLKEAVFSSLGDRVRGKRVADLFAGSGALGIEALSRGAVSAVFVELDPRAVKVIRLNLETLDLHPPEACVRRMDAWHWLKRYSADPSDISQRVELMLLDPPYQEGTLGRLLPLVTSLLVSGAIEICVIEHPAVEAESLVLPAGIESKTRCHGSSAFSIIEGMNS